MDKIQYCNLLYSIQYTYIQMYICKRQVSVCADLERGSGQPTPPLWKVQISEINVIKLSKIGPPGNQDIPCPFPHPPGKTFWIRPWSVIRCALKN